MNICPVGCVSCGGSCGKDVKTLSAMRRPAGQPLGQRQGLTGRGPHTLGRMADIPLWADFTEADSKKLALNQIAVQRTARRKAGQPDFISDYEYQALDPYIKLPQLIADVEAYNNGLSPVQKALIANTGTMKLVMLGVVGIASYLLWTGRK